MGLREERCLCSPVRVVVIDSREERRALMVDVVDGDGGRVAVVAVADGHDSALRAVDEEAADGVVIDLRMPTGEGLRTVRDLRAQFPALAIVVCSFDLDGATVREVLAQGADACVAKPAAHEDLAMMLEAARLVSVYDAGVVDVGAVAA